MFKSIGKPRVERIDIDVEGTANDRILEGFKKKYGADRVFKVLTLSTEKPRRAIQDAARGLGINDDIANDISSLIVSDRGEMRSLHTMYYGNGDYESVQEFVRVMDENPELWEMAQRFEGLVTGIGSHAGGIVIVDEPITESASVCRTSTGDIITSYELHDLEKVSLIKIDLLKIDAADKMHATLDLLLKCGKIKWQGNLKDTYEKYLGVYTLERTAEDMWRLLWEHKVVSFFQMEKQSGVRALSLAKPRSVDDLATINSVIRLMAQEKGAEPPLEKFARFHEDITLWYKEMTDYGLTEHEQDILKGIIGVSYGICEAQEYLVLLTSHPEIGGFSLGWGDRLRKAVA